MNAVVWAMLMPAVLVLVGWIAVELADEARG